MKKPAPSSSTQGIRLTDAFWPMLRRLMKAKGRKWLEAAIQREHNKLEKPQVKARTFGANES